MNRELYKRAATPIARSPITRLAAAAALSLLPLLAAAPAHVAVRFTVTNLGTLGGTSSEAFAINASGRATAFTPSRRSVS